MATKREILETEATRFSELIKAMFGNDVCVEIDIFRVEQKELEAISGNDRTFHIIQKGIAKVDITSKEYNPTIEFFNQQNQ